MKVKDKKINVLQEFQSFSSSEKESGHKSQLVPPPNSIQCFFRVQLGHICDGFALFIQFAFHYCRAF